MVWVVSLSTTKLIPRSLSPGIVVMVFGVWLGLVGGKPPMPIQSLYPHNVVPRGYTSIYFGENQLSLRLIRLSLLPTAHPIGFQPKRVRSSTQYNPRFNLAMGRSRSFGSATRDNRPIQTRFPYGFSPEDLNLATNGNSPDHYAKGTPSPMSRT
jgi:hypothetical protein